MRVRKVKTLPPAPQRFYEILSYQIFAALCRQAQSRRVAPTPTPTPRDDEAVRVLTEEVKLNVLAFDSASAFDFVWLMSYMVWGAAALHPSMYAVAQPVVERPAGFSRRRLVALTLALLASLTVLNWGRSLGA